MRLEATKAFIFLSAMLGLLGCQSSIYSLTQESLYSPADYRYAAADKRLHTVLWGNPTAQSDEVFNHRVLDIMQAVNTSFEVPLVRPTTFTTGQGDRPDYHVVVAFNPTVDTTPADLCADSIAVLDDQSQTGIEARMAFCWRTRVLSTSYAVVEELQGPDDPRFQRMIHNLTRELFPQRKSRNAREGGLLLN